MSSSTHSHHLPALEEPHMRDEAGEQLQAMLVELVDLSLLGKQLHWTVVGARFHPLHLQLDGLVDSWRELSDTVAERAVALGFMPDGQSAAIAAATPLRPVERGELADDVVVRELTGRLADVAERTRRRVERMGEFDLASQDVLIEVLRALEEQLWMMRVQMDSGG